MNSIEILNSTPPPKPTRRFANARAANAEITRLEKLLGEEPSPFIGNIGAASRRVELLGKLLSARACAMSPVAAAPAAALPAGPSLAVLRDMETAVFGNHAGNYNDPAAKQVAAIARRIYESNLTVPGLSLTALAAAGAWKGETTGAARSVRQLEQSKIDAFFNPEQ